MKHSLSGPAALGVALCCGCSLVAIRPVPSRFGDDAEVSCSSPGWAIADGAAALIVLALNSLAAGIAESTNGYGACETNKSACHTADRAPGYWVAGGFGASALYGAIATATCNAKLEEPRRGAAAAASSRPITFTPSAP